MLQPDLWSFDFADGACKRHPVKARRIGSIAFRESGGLALACDNGLFAYDPETATQTILVDPEPGRPANRKNDGRADSSGSFWVGTLEEDSFAAVGCLYRVAPDLSVQVAAEGLSMPNAIAFDPGRGRMYFADTRAYTIWSCEHDPLTGRLGERRVFAETNAPARPDGSCVDEEGCIWNAEYAGGRVMRYSPVGEIVRVFDLPVSHPTCCCFAGPDLDRLVVISALEPLSPEEGAREPFAGKTFVMNAGVRGRPEYRVRF